MNQVFGHSCMTGDHVIELPVVNHVTEIPETSTNTVIVTQPRSGDRQWSSGICDCLSDFEMCLYTIYCGICLHCAVAKKLDESGCSGACLSGQVALRTKYRLRHKIRGNILDDMCVVTWCNGCALGQILRDMEKGMYPRTCCGVW
uniref:Cornifelin homolog n=1 Tax=Phallusia mammillata TaxID=59560 RepID=A0A6F9D9G0_9ASCI|nr:cornifelin homolog [Phallusia mammillata]